MVLRRFLKTIQSEKKFIQVPRSFHIRRKTGEKCKILHIKVNHCEFTVDIEEKKKKKKNIK